MKYLFTVIVLIAFFSCNAPSDNSSNQKPGMSFAAVLPPTGNYTIVNYGPDTLYTYVTNKDTIITVSYTYTKTKVDTVWHRVGQTPTNLPPVVNAGANQTITLPSNSVTLSGTATDPDGSIASYFWAKMSGNGGTITSPALPSTTVTGLTEGSYTFRLSATDNNGLTSSSNVTVIVNPAPVVPSNIQGFGSGVTGGSASSVVYHVTNLNSSGSGSLANGIGSNKTIVFDVSGTITTRLYITSLVNLTIDAYSSQQDITIDNANNGDGLAIEGTSSNIIIRGIRFINAGLDGAHCAESSKMVVFDHCTFAGNRDGNLDFAATSSVSKNFTAQWCMLYNNQGAGNMLITTQMCTVHHCLFVGDGKAPDGQERNPYAHSNYSPAGSGSTPNFDFRNNLITASGRYASGCGYKAVGNFVNNYYTSSNAGLINLCADNSGCGSTNAGSAYVSGNFNQPNATGQKIVSTEFTPASQYQVNTTDAKTAALAVKQSVGTYKKTTKEQDIINSIVIP